jgi:hypothetical protein
MWRTLLTGRVTRSVTSCKMNADVLRRGKMGELRPGILIGIAMRCVSQDEAER